MNRSLPPEAQSRSAYSQCRNVQYEQENHERYDQELPQKCERQLQGVFPLRFPNWTQAKHKFTSHRKLLHDAHLCRVKPSVRQPSVILDVTFAVVVAHARPIGFEDSKSLAPEDWRKMTLTHVAIASFTRSEAALRRCSLHCMAANATRAPTRSGLVSTAWLNSDFACSRSCSPRYPRPVR